MFYYGRRFEGEGLLNSIFILKWTFLDSSTVPIDEQISEQIGTDEDPNKHIEVFGRLLIKKTESGDDLIILKNGLSSIQLDINALENFSYFHGMVIIRVL
jgi:hypothetical protein